VVSRRVALLVALAVVVAAIVGLVLTLGDRGVSSAPLPTGPDGLAARALLTPRGVLFGDQIVARVDIVVDRERLDPGEVAIDTQFAPFIVSREQLEREDFQRFTRLTYRYELDCLESACVPDTFEKPIQFPQVIVRAEGAEQATVEWPLFLISARVRETGAAAANAREWRAAPVVHAPTYRTSPTLLTALLVGVALVLLAAAATALAVGLRGVSLKRRRRLTALERALAVLEQAHATGAADEKRLALDRLADELRATGAGDLAVSARRLAWAEEVPADERTADLSDDVRGLLNGGGRNGRH
jgi:hypothetical protein